MMQLVYTSNHKSISYRLAVDFDLSKVKCDSAIGHSVYEFLLILGILA